MTRNIQYQVWQVGGGYFQSFMSYTKATELRDELSNKYPHCRFTIIEDEWYD